MILPIFLQAASNILRGSQIRMVFTGTTSNVIDSITCSGTITVKSTYNGVYTEHDYTDLEEASVTVQSDVDTPVLISGGTVTALQINNNHLISLAATNTALTTLNCSDCSALQSLDVTKNTALESLDCDSCYALQSLDVTKNTALESLNCDSCYALQSLDVTKNTALTTLNCSYCSALQSLDVTKNTALTTLNCSNDTALTTIGYNAVNTTVASALAAAVTAATSTTGTFHLKTGAAYNSAIETACTSKGWTAVYDIAA